jgi:hypothetical protein
MDLGQRSYELKLLNHLNKDRVKRRVSNPKTFKNKSQNIRIGNK